MPNTTLGEAAPTATPFDAAQGKLRTSSVQMPNTSASLGDATRTLSTSAQCPNKITYAP
ncbi:MAG: hypothetical protein V7K54_05495 [Nostoc sp.]